MLQLQQEKRQLRQELESLMKEQDLLETKLRSYEREKTNFAPALEETQWEVRQWEVTSCRGFADTCHVHAGRAVSTLSAQANAAKDSFMTKEGTPE